MGRSPDAATGRLKTMTREEWHEICELKIEFRSWEERFSTADGPGRSVSDGTLPMPDKVAPPPPDQKQARSARPLPPWPTEKAPFTFLPTPSTSRTPKPDAGCKGDRTEHHFNGFGKDRYGRSRRRCKYCRRTEVIGVIV